MKFDYIIIIFILFFSYNSCEKKEKLRDRKDFSIEKTGEIDLIILQNKTPKKVILSKNNEEWKINDLYSARKEAIDLLLETVRDMQIKRPVATLKLWFWISQHHPTQSQY